jgi:hypothetical protein
MNTATPEAPIVVELTHRDLISAGLWERLIGRIVKDEGIERSLAERIMNEAVGFLLLCAAEPDEKYSPSRTVDVGWHTFILHTQAYAAFCESINGAFIHHEPFDGEASDGDALISRTVDALASHNFPVDADLWLGLKGKCSTACGVQCDSPPCSH